MLILPLWPPKFEELGSFISSSSSSTSPIMSDLVMRLPDVVMIVVPAVVMIGMDNDGEEVITGSVSNFTSSIDTSVVVLVEGVSKDKNNIDITNEGYILVIKY